MNKRYRLGLDILIRIGAYQNGFPALAGIESLTIPHYLITIRLRNEIFLSINKTPFIALTMMILTVKIIAASE